MKKRIVILFLIISALNSKSQINLAQYTDGLNGYYTGSDTAYQLFNEIKSQQDEDFLLNTYFPFNTTEVDNCYTAISFTDTLTPKPEVDFPYYIPWVNDSNYYRAHQLRFQLNNNTGYVFCYKNPTNASNSKTAFIIIPGSGINQATAIALYNPGNYHNNTCAIAQNCIPYGDVYTYVRPNEDFASFWTTTAIGEFKKLNYLAQTSKTNLANKNWAANCYIQIIALTKYLQGKYDKVVVLGLSSGAWGVMFSALQTEPEGALLASGYSINFNDQTYTANFNQMQYDGMFSSHPIDSVRQTIRAQKTQFLFSYGANDLVTNMADENSNHTTENYFNTPTPPDNTTYFYNFTQHRFPCEIIDSFFTKINKMPKVHIEPINTCTSDSLVLRLRFVGTAPFEGMLYRNNMLYQSVYSLNDTLLITLYNEGEFEFKNLLDSNQITGFKSEPFTYNKTTALTPGNITQQYVCNTDSTLIHLPINGTPPYLVTCLDTNNNTIQTNTYFNQTIQFYKKNGNYRITSISDSNNCIWTIPIPFHVANDTLQINFNTANYWCDSNQHQLNIQTKGKSPWTIQYYKSGSLFTELFSDSNRTFLFDNGQYLFTQISDFNNCLLNLNQYYNFYATPLQISLATPVYSCDSNKTKIDIQTAGNPPFTLHYTENNQAKQVSWNGNSISLFFEYGQYYFSHIEDITHCVDSISTNLNLNNQAIGFSLSNLGYDCDSNKRQIQFNVQGNGPWVMNYSKNGQWLQDTFLQANNTRYYDNGLYQFATLFDATGCSTNINQSYNFNDQALSWNLIQQQYNCNTNLFQTLWNFTGNVPFTIHYTLNNGPIQSEVFNIYSASWSLPNGQYQIIDIQDQTGCTQSINLTLLPNYNSIAISNTTPVYDCDSNKRQIKFNVQGNGPWVMNYSKNGQWLQDTFLQANNTRYYDNGLYQFATLFDATGCSTNINQSYNFNDQALSWNLIQQQYNCNTNLFQTLWNFTGNVPFTIHYTLNNGPIQSEVFNTYSASWSLPNGQYQIIDIQDQTGCTQSINLTLLPNYNSIAISNTTPVYDCDSNKRQIKFNVQGNGPWVMNYSKNGLWLQDTFLLANNTRYYDNGLYQFATLFDATGCSTNINQSYNFNDQALSWNLIQQQYNCNTNLFQTLWNFTGNVPFTIHYTLNNGPIQSEVFNTYSASWSLPNGQYQIIDIQDQTGCTQSINLTLLPNYNSIAISNTTPVYDCDSNKRQIQFNVQGNGPWVMNYSKNGLWLQDTFLLANNTRYYDNGLYQFNSISDATGCSTNINQSYNFNDQALSWNLTQQQYDCDSNLFHLRFVVQGNAPFSIHYESVGGFSYTKTMNSNTIDLYLPNGQWLIQQISDATGCIQNINLPFNLSFQALSVSSLLPVYDCDSNKMRLAYSLLGNEPFTFKLNQLNTNSTQWINTNLFNPIFWVPQGQYLMQEVSDATGCKRNINQYIQHNIQALNYQTMPKLFDCDSNQVKYPIQLQGNAPFNISYRNLNNGLLFTKNTQQSNLILALGSGHYVMESISDAYCTIASNDTLLVHFPALQVQVNSPGILCDSGKAAIGVNYQSGLLPAYLTWVYNGIPDSVLLQTGLQTILMPNGTYFMQHIRDSANCLQPINLTYNANYTPLAWQGISHSYNCSKDSSEIAIHFSGALQTAMYYTKNNVPDTLYLNNNIHQTRWPRGDYRIVYLRDSAQCILPIDTQFVIRDVPVNIVVDTLQALCESKLHQYTFSLEGRSPWLMTYNNKNFSRTITFIDSTNTWICEPGVYDFVSIEDANGCKRVFERHDSLATFVENTPIITTNYKYIILTPSIYPIQWYYNQQALDTVQYSASSLQLLGGGKYQASVRDNAGCIWTSNALEFTFDNPISLYPNPANNEVGILVQDVFGDYWQYTITNAQGEKMKTGKVYNALELINVQTWSAGVYFVTIHYQNNPNTRVIRMIKQ